MGINLNADKRPAVFLDRDGVLNEAIICDGKPYPPRGLSEVVIVEGAVSSLASLKAAGFLLLVVTNQPDVARGQTSIEEVNAVNDYLQANLQVDAFLVCPHDDADDCLCRKPRPGLLLQGAEQFAVDLAASYMVGDRWKDIEAGYQAGCSTIWINREYREEGSNHSPDKTASSLIEAVDWILGQKERQS